MTSQSVETNTICLREGSYIEIYDHVAIEEPLEIRLDYLDGLERRPKSVSITMRTPGHDQELAVGFLFTEGILTKSSDIVSITGCGPMSGPHKGQNIVKIKLKDGADLQWPKLERHFYSTSSCGVCGKSSLEALEVQGLKVVDKFGFRISTECIRKLAPTMRANQSVFDQTGGLHAAALFSQEGNLIALREDVGRHNALDKLIGSQFLAQTVPLTDRLLFLSGRASFELIQKSVVAGIPFVAAVGAPSSLAVDLARKFDITLLGFVREDRFNIYHGHWRLLGELQ